MISLILPTFNEEENLPLLHERITAVVDKMEGFDFEFVFVDDCSRDDSYTILKRLADSDRRVHIIKFARNCGSHAAVAAGLHACRGDAAIMLATDLQDPPEVIPALVDEWQKGCNIVWGVRKKREGESPWTILTSRVFYQLMNHLTDVVQPPTGADIFLIDAQALAAYRSSPEKNTSVYMLIAWLGFSQTSIEYVKKERHAGHSKWNTSRRLKLFFDSLISFSYVPLRFMGLTGAVSAALGVLYSLLVLYNAFRGEPVQGWTSLMIVVLFLGGFQMIMLGMLGEYLWRTYDETRGRPRYVIEKNTLLENGPDRGEERPDGI